MAGTRLADLGICGTDNIKRGVGAESVTHSPSTREKIRNVSEVLRHATSIGFVLPSAQRRRCPAS
ncbi:hypothetical protein FMEAI12_4280067 [Parafrankia sp. Ea1.12]|nr:hypothetical protein FMEAI12_4280067 [Parafrankia sp. Ea1.12]